jgi:FtsZ-binding cell division protein ZapB
MTKKNEKNDIDEKLDITLFDAIETIENLDTEVEDLTEENGKLDQACYKLLQCFNKAKYNSQNHSQWTINYIDQCNAEGIEVKQKNVAEKTKSGIIKPNLKKLDNKMRSRISKIKKFQCTTVSTAQAKNGIEPIGKVITERTKWYAIVKAVKPVVDQVKADKIKLIKGWSIDDIDQAIEFIVTIRNSMEIVDNKVKTSEVYNEWAKDLKTKFQARQNAIELEKNAVAEKQANAK